MIFPPRSPRSSTIRIDPRESLFCITPTARSDTSSRPLVSRWAALLRPDRSPNCDRGTRCRSPASPTGLRCTALNCTWARARSWRDRLVRRCQVMAHDRGWATLRLPSGEMRLVDERCSATIGVVGNEDHSNQSLGKAGRNRWKGRRPKVRGSAMNPNDHPHGGGEGKSPTGFPPKTPWGKPALGYKTRRGRRRSDKFILRKRK